MFNSLYGNQKILKGLSRYFKRSVQLNNTVYRGSFDNEDVYELMGESNERISFKVKKPMHTFLYDLAYVMNCSVSKASAVLIYESLTDGRFIEHYLQDYLEALDPNRKKELKQLIKYIKLEIGEGYSLADLLSYLVEEPIKWNFPK